MHWLDRLKNHEDMNHFHMENNGPRIARRIGELAYQQAETETFEKIIKILDKEKDKIDKQMEIYRSARSMDKLNQIISIIDIIKYHQPKKL